jgi:hypothetical protein
MVDKLTEMVSDCPADILLLHKRKSFARKRIHQGSIYTVALLLSDLTVTHMAVEAVVRVSGFAASCLCDSAVRRIFQRRKAISRKLLLFLFLLRLFFRMQLLPVVPTFPAFLSPLFLLRC